jgi:uncharacterized membrane protein SirB2
MNTQSLLHLLLSIHLIALTMAVGITIASTVASNQFWKLYDKDKLQGISAFRGIKKFQLFGGLGLLLLIVSGVGMLSLYNGAFHDQLWFQIKMTCILLMIVNGVTLGRITTNRMSKLLNGDGQTSNPGTDIPRLKRNQAIFYATQLSLFVVIIVLASFRFV